MASTFYTINKALFWTVFPVFVGAAFSLGYYFASNKYDTHKHDLYEENQRLKETIADLENSIRIQKDSAQCESELDFFLHKYLDNAKPTLLSYKEFLEIMQGSLSIQGVAVSDPQCMPAQNGGVVVRYHVTGGKKNMDVYADWLVDSANDKVMPKSEFAKHIEIALSAMK